MDVAAQQAEIRRLVGVAHEHITLKPGSDDRKAVEAFDAAAVIALDVVKARIDSGDEPPSALSDDDRAAWRLLSDASNEYHHANNALGDWYRESARRRALEPYTRSNP